MESNNRGQGYYRGSKRGGDNSEYRGGYRGKREGYSKGGGYQREETNGYTVKHVKDGKFDNSIPKPQTAPQPVPAPQVKKQGTTAFVSGFENIFAGQGWGDMKPLVFEEPPKKVEEQPKPAAEELPKQNTEVKIEEVKKDISDIKPTKQQNDKPAEQVKDKPRKHYQKKGDYQKRQDQPSTKPEEEKKVEDEKKVEPEEPKVPVKQDFVPDANFCWNLDLEAIATKQQRQNKATNNFIPAVIKVDQSQVQSKSLGQDLKLKIKENLAFSITQLDKICNKGLTNNSNCCFMNVCLQSLLSSPAFFNMLIAISSNQEIMKELNKEGSQQNLLAKFVYLARFFNPIENIDPTSPFSKRTVNAENIFNTLIGEFNPFSGHQDCHEFLVLILDRLHDEMAMILKEENSKKTAETADEWHEVGSGNQQKTFNNEKGSLTQASLIRDIFGGLLRTEFHVEGRKNCTVSFEPFFALNLEISRVQDLQSCLSSYFTSKYLDDYKDENGKIVRAYHQQLIEQLPNILILQLKRFVYKDRIIKMKEDVEFPEVLTIENNYISTQLQARIGGAQEDYSGRQYRLFSVINHRGIEATKGHYVSYALDSNNEWILYDDNKVKKAPHGLDSVLNSQAYLLFYEKIVD